MVNNVMPLTYCGNQVRQGDPDRFILSLFAPANRREALWALYAFNLEIAKTRDVVSETTLGLIRLQWWRDALAGIYERDEVLAHEVLEDLAVAIKTYDLPRELFNDLIYAREFDLEDRAPDTMDGLMNYADYTHTPLVQLSLMVLGEEKAVADESVIQTIAVNYMLIKIIRSVPFYIKRHQCLLPNDLMKQFDVSQSNYFNFKEKEKITQILKEILKVAEPYRNIQSKHLQVMQNLTQMHRRQMINVNGDVFDPQVVVGPKFKALRLWWSSLRCISL